MFQIHELSNSNKEKEQLKLECGIIQNKLKTALNNYKLENETRIVSMYIRFFIYLFNLLYNFSPLKRVVRIYEHN